MVELSESGLGRFTASAVKTFSSGTPIVGLKSCFIGAMSNTHVVK